MDLNIQEIVRGLLRDVVYPFYDLERDLYICIRPNPENNAEHSWSLALIAAAMAEHFDPDLDISKIIAFSIIHDVVEIICGDVPVHSSDPMAHALKEQREAEAVDTLESQTVSTPWIVEMIREYERKDTPEALYVWAMDKYVGTLMQLDHEVPKYKELGLTLKKYNEGMDRARAKASHYPPVAKLLDEVIEHFNNHPELFADEPIGVE